MSGSTSASAEVQDLNRQDALPDNANLSETSERCPLQHENEGEGNKQRDDNGKENVPEEEDEEEDADFNPFLKETNSIEASSSLSSEVEDLDTDVADSMGKASVAFGKNSNRKCRDIMKGGHTGGNVEHGVEIMMPTTISSGEVYRTSTEKESTLITQSENGWPCDKENGLTSLTDVGNATDSGKAMDAEDAICMRTRARYSLASFTLDELETFLQETDDEDDLQNVDDEEEYRKFLAAVLRGDNSENLQGNTNADDEDEENDADFELELEEALESEPEEIEKRRLTRRNRCQKASLEHSKKLSGQLNRPLRPLLPFASIGSFPASDGKHLMHNIAPSYMPPVNNGLTYGFTPHQIGQLHCLIHEHIQLLIQVFSVCVLDPVKKDTAAEVKELVLEMLKKRDQVLAWRTVPYLNFCFFPPYIHPSVTDELQKMFPLDGNNKNVQQVPSGSNREPHSDLISLSNGRHKHLPADQAGSSQTLGCTSWLPYICGPVLSVMDVAPLKLVENYIDDVSSAVRAYERYQIELGSETRCEKEPLFLLQNSQCSAESDQGETEDNPPDSGAMLSSSSNNQIPKKTMAATLLEKAKNQSVALVPKEIAKLAQRFWPLFNPALYPHKPPPAPLANRVLFTDAEDELLALGLMEYNTDWEAIKQRFLPCKSKHQIFVRQKNRASSKAPENPIKAVRKIKNSPLTSEEIARIEVGLKKFKLDWISIWRFFVPYRDPSLLPRQWRIASGTQKSYKSDANKKAKRRLYELRRKTSKPAPSTWHSSSEKEGDSTDNAVEETNSGDNHVDKEDEAYVHEAFLADWRPDSNVASSFPAHLPSQEAPQATEHKDNSGSGSGYVQPQMCSPAASRSSSSHVILRPYRARRPNTARLVKLAPDLPPVNLPPSVRVMSQSAFKSSQGTATAMISGNASRMAGVVVENQALHSRSTMRSVVPSSVSSGPYMNNSVKITASSRHPNHSEVTTDKSPAERVESDLQMHPLLFQEPQEGHLPYYPLNGSMTASSSSTFFPGKQLQLNLSLFHNPRHIRDAVNFLSKSSKPPEKNASSLGVDFHPLLQRTDDVDSDSIAAQHATRLPSSAESRQRCTSIHYPSTSISKPSLNGGSSASGSKVASLSGKINELDLDIHLSCTSKGQGSSEKNMTPCSTIESQSAKDSSQKKDFTPDGINHELDSDDVALVTSRNKGSRKLSDNMRDDSLPEIIMEQEELSDSDEEFGENVEFECEEMADSEGDSTSDSEQLVSMPNEEAQLDQIDAEFYDGQVLNTHNVYGGNPCSTSGGHSVGVELAKKGVNMNPNVVSFNLNSRPPVSPHSNVKNGVGGYEFGPFGTTGIFGQNQLSKRSRAGHMQKRSKDAAEHLSGDTLARNPRKRVCRSSSGSGIAGPGRNSSSSRNMSVGNLKNVNADDFG